MKKSFVLIALSALMLASCTNAPVASSEKASSSESSSSAEGKPTTYKDLKIISPAGAPTLSLYTEVQNENFQTTSVPSEVMLAYKTSTSQDAVIFDGMNALKLAKAKQTAASWKLARWLTGGNFYIVSTKHTAEEGLVAGSTFLSFGKDLLPDTVFKKLSEERWNYTLGDNVNYLDGTAQVSAILGSDQYASYDYYFIAEPSLMAAKAKLKESHPDVTVNEIYNLRAEWKAYSGLSAIPQAALFVNESAYSQKEGQFEALLSQVDKNLEKAVTNPSEVVSEINSLEIDPDKQAAKLGYKAAVVSNLQSDGKNRFGIVKPGEISSNMDFANGFYKAMGVNLTFGMEFFL